MTSAAGIQLRTEDLLGDELKSLKQNVPGVNSPFLYVGQARSILSMHIEDEELWSVNYLHSGFKTWIVIPPGEKEQLEKYLAWVFRVNYHYTAHCAQVWPR